MKIINLIALIFLIGATFATVLKTNTFLNEESESERGHIGRRPHKPRRDPRPQRNQNTNTTTIAQNN